MPGPRSGLHAKSFVIDGHISMVGSHNLDPRGEGYNTENGVIIDDVAFARELEASIRKDIKPGNSWVAAMKPPGPRSWAVSMAQLNQLRAPCRFLISGPTAQPRSMNYGLAQRWCHRVRRSFMKITGRLEAFLM